MSGFTLYRIPWLLLLESKMPHLVNKRILPKISPKGLTYMPLARNMILNLGELHPIILPQLVTHQGLFHFHPSLSLVREYNDFYSSTIRLLLRFDSYPSLTLNNFIDMGWCLILRAKALSIILSIYPTDQAQPVYTHSSHMGTGKLSTSL